MLGPDFNKGVRYNEGKLRYDLVDQHAHEQMVKVLTFGAKKYAARNWEKGMAWTSVIASMERHLAAIKKGEDYDSESGILHAAHIACNAHFLTAYYRIYPQGDDRPHKYLNPLKIGLDIDEVICDWVGGWCKKFNHEIPDSWSFSYDFKHEFESLGGDMEDFYLNLERKMDPADLPFEPHCYITSRSVPAELTKKWLKKNGFPTVPVYSIGHGQSKVEVAKQSGIEVFVDDRFENFVELNNAGICCFLFDAKHNRKYNVGFKRIYSLSDLGRM